MCEGYSSRLYLDSVVMDRPVKAVSPQSDLLIIAGCLAQTGTVQLKQVSAAKFV